MEALLSYQQTDSTLYPNSCKLSVILTDAEHVITSKVKQMKDEVEPEVSVDLCLVKPTLKQLYVLRNKKKKMARPYI